MRIPLTIVLAATTLAAATMLGETPLPPYANLKYPPLKEVKVPEIPQYRLANGIRLYLLENHELPLVSGFALVRTGSLFDPAGKTGLAEMTGSVMRTGGTTSKTGDQIDVQIENMAASVESGIGASSGRVGFSCLRENTPEVLSIFKDVLMHPAFRQEKIDLIKGQYAGMIARRNDEASGVASREFSKILYGPGSPYGREMEYSDLGNIQRGDLMTFYQRYFFPANTIVAIEGDFKAADMKDQIEKLFADWTTQQPEVGAFPNVDKTPHPGVYLGVKNDVTQTFFELGHLSGILKDKNYPALEVMADILGGGFSSRLFKVVRTQHGYAYSIYAGWGAGFTQPGIFRIGGSTKSANTLDSIQASLKELALMRTQEVSAEELKTAKDTVLNSFVFNFDSPTKTLNRLITYEYNGYPKDFIFQYQKAIERVTAADILGVAKEYLKPENLTIVAVGKASDFGKPLTGLGPVKTIDLTIPPAKPAPSAAAIEKGKSMLARAQKAMNGVQQVDAIKDVTQSGDFYLQTGDGGLRGKQTSQFLLPVHMRKTQDFPFARTVSYFDGKEGWVSTPQGLTPLPVHLQAQFRSELFRQLIQVLQSGRNPECTVSAAVEDMVDVSDMKGNVLHIRVNPQGLPIQEVYTSNAGNLPVTETYFDWRRDAGLRLPYRIVVQQGEERVEEIKVAEWKLNSGLTLAELSKQP